jgi:hypothetical protein
MSAIFPKKGEEIAKTEVVRKWATKLTPELIEVAERSIGLGLPVASCAGIIGVHKATWQRWLAEGQKEDCKDPLVAELALRVEKARQDAILKGVKNMGMHATRDYRAQLELLKAQDPATWVQTQRIQQEVKVITEEEDLSDLSDEELELREMIESKVKKKQIGAGK